MKSWPSVTVECSRIHKVHTKTHKVNVIKQTFAEALPGGLLSHDLQLNGTAARLPLFANLPLAQKQCFKV